jgi:hypothetical protein
MPEILGYIKKCPCQWLLRTVTTHLDTCPYKEVDNEGDEDEEQAGR